MIRRVGVLVGLVVGFCLMSSAAAETIPFDYWYGRIIGRTQIQSIHDAYNGETGVLTTNVRVGYGDDVSVGLGNLTRMSEASGSGAFYIKFYRPQLSANVAAGARTRWVISELDWQDDSDFRIVGSQVIFNTQSTFQSDQTVRMLHEDIEYDPARSLYYYSSGMLLQPRNWSLDVRLQTYIYDNSEQRSWPKYISEEQGTLNIRRQSYHDSRFWSINTAFGYGISEKLQIQIGWLLERGSQPSGRTDELYRPTGQDSVLERYSESGETRQRDYELYVEPVFLQSSHHWISIRPSFKSQPTSNQNDYEYPADAAFPQDAGRYKSKDRTYGVGIKHTWISSGEPIARSQILDDYGGYYGRRLGAGTLRINTTASWSLGRSTSEQWRERGDGTQYDNDRYESREDQLTATSEVTYYSKYNLDLSLRATLVRRSSGGGQLISDAVYYHTQAHYFDIRLSYSSYRWNPEQRKEIAWDKVRDMDYLYGPLLRPGDFRSSITVSPPADRWTYRGVKESIFNFFKGESDNRWNIASSSAYGLCDGIEVSLGVYFDQDWYHYDDGPQQTRKYQTDQWSISPTFRWQPGQRFRVDFSASENYKDSDEVTRYNGHESRWHEYRHTWQLYVVYTILI